MAARESVEAVIGNDISPRVNEYVRATVVSVKAVVYGPLSPAVTEEKANGSKKVFLPSVV
jgi:hypothetical protein